MRCDCISDGEICENDGEVDVLPGNIFSQVLVIVRVDEWQQGVYYPLREGLGAEG